MMHRWATEFRAFLLRGNLVELERGAETISPRALTARPRRPPSIAKDARAR